MNKLRELREEHNLLQKEVCDILGVSQQQYSHLESGKSMLNSEQMVKLAEYYNVSADYILGLIQRPRPLHEYKKNMYSGQE